MQIMTHEPLKVIHIYLYTRMHKRMSLHHPYSANFYAHLIQIAKNSQLAKMLGHPSDEYAR